MLNIFNRKELIISRDMRLIVKIREQLRRAGIEHRVITRNISGAYRQHGIPFIDSDHSYEYRIFVHRKDYEQACYVRRTM